jgi:ubiquinone/menaquinone biosynthesis C-methylase UbiE
MDVNQLREHLRKMESISDESWLASLDERKRKELEFHDLHRDQSKIEKLDQDTYEQLYGNHKYYAATEYSTSYFNDRIRAHSRGRIVLDYACGNGGNAIRAAKAGAALAIGIDISRVSVQNARASAAKEGVGDNTYFVQADAENTKLPDASIDCIICAGMLHHLDLKYAFPELSRILAPGGRILAMEALDYNPAIKLYRQLTPNMRTEWEKSHILSLKDIRAAKAYFDIGEIRYWHIASIAGGKFPSLLPALNGLDRILTKIPLVRLMAWIFTFELLKQKRAAST